MSEPCPCCGQPIDRSVYALRNGELYKSCPRCSQKSNVHEFYPCPSGFGFRKKENGEPFVQSQCPDCRFDRGIPPFRGHIPCTDKSLRFVRSVRILPVSDERFGGADSFESFLMDVVPERGYRYYFRTGLDDPEGSLVLFQHRSGIKGYGLIRGAIRTPGGFDVDSVHYAGYYEFHPDTLGLFPDTITYEMLKVMDPSVSPFSQAKQRLNVSILPMLFDEAHQSIPVAVPSIPEEVRVDPDRPLYEGAVRQVTVNAYERNPAARRECIEAYREPDGKIRCQICGMEFSERYGPEFIGLIHIHHIVEISSVGKEYRVNPKRDLIPVCPNCHAAIHSRTPPYAPEELRETMLDASDDVSPSEN